MVIRIVRMHFKEGNEERFLEIFNTNKKLIRHVQGCVYLALLVDANHSNVYTTISHWNSVEDLENYRKSALFKDVWGSVKVLFSDSPQAFTLEKIVEL